MSRLACGSLRDHAPHDWIGRTSATVREETLKIYHCDGHRPQSMSNSAAIAAWWRSRRQPKPAER